MSEYERVGAGDDPDVRLPELDALPTTGFAISPTSVGDDAHHQPAHTQIASVAVPSLGLSQKDRLELRRVVLRAAYTSVKDHARMTYTEGALRWSGITDQCHDIDDRVPPYCDCSSFATWAYWDASRWLKLGDFVNGLNWIAGYTGTMTPHGERVATPQTADLVFYGGLQIPYHVAIYIGNGRVVSMGRPGAPEIVPVGPATQFRRYVL